MVNTEPPSDTFVVITSRYQRFKISELQFKTF